MSSACLEEGFGFVTALKICAKTRNLSRGIGLHGDILDRGFLEKIPYLASCLISMYVKCGALAQAQKVHDELPFRDEFAWNALIVGYAQRGHDHEAMECFQRMQNEGNFPDAVTYTCILKACAKTGNIEDGRKVHEDVLIRNWLKNDVMLGTALVDMYVKCEMLETAHLVLEQLPVRNTISWNALMSGYGQHGQCLDVLLSFFKQMLTEGLTPDAITFICLLKACGNARAIDKGQRIHDMISNRGLLAKDIILGSALVDMYARCSMVMKAAQILKELPVRNAISWSALISGYVQHDQAQEALNCFQQMQSEGIPPDAVTFICVLTACGMAGLIRTGEEIHAEIMRRSILAKDIGVGNALVGMYAKCGLLRKAENVFDSLSKRDAVSWNAFITGYVLQDQVNQAFHYVELMQNEGYCPDAVTFVSILKACGNIRAIDKGKQIYDNIVIRGLLGKDAMLGNAVIDMFIKCGKLSKAKQVFEGISHKDVVSWNVLISGYAQHGQGHEALNCYEKMQSGGLSPDVITLICTLQACGSIGAIAEGKRIHKGIANCDLLDTDIRLGNALIDMYAKCGLLGNAQQVLRDLHNRDVVSWNTLIAGYSQHNQYHEGWKCLERMQCECLCPDMITFVSILNACASTGAVEKGKQVHNRIIISDLLEKSIIIGNALVDMYAKCGVLGKAQQLLEELPFRDIASWNALIGGYARQGQGYKALNCHQQLLNDGLFPDEVTLMCFLNACSHSGLLGETHMLFAEMVNKYLMIPNLEHHSCIVAGFGYVGQFDKALSVIKEMTSSDYPPVWLAVLSACRKWGNRKLGILAFDQAIQLDHTLSAPYVLMSSIFASAGMQEDAQSIDATQLKYACMEK